MLRLRSLARHCRPQPPSLRRVVTTQRSIGPIIAGPCFRRSLSSTTSVDITTNANNGEPQVSDRTQSKQDKKAAKEAKKANAAAKQQVATQAQVSAQKTIRLKKEFINVTPPGEKKIFNEPMADAYDPSSVEAAWYSWWEKSGFFKPEAMPDAKEQFVIVIPPPNVTGSLHLGHALTNSIEDAYCRWNRMSGRRVLWVPGTDHAGIATQAVVEKKIWKEEGKTRHDLGREEFVKRIWDWKNLYGSRITSQLRRIGSSVDWGREAFTMDDNLSRAVSAAFVRMYDSGMIYRSNRLVNWCSKLRTAISDIEVDYIDIPKRTKMQVPQHSKSYEFGILLEFAYKVVGSDKDEELVVATTRPETLLGDTAVAVHPDDPRYKHLHGRLLQHPFLDRTIPIITDPVLVDMNFGTGAVKITPAHDPNDYECGKRNELQFINVLNLDGTINDNGGKFAGMLRYDCRTAIIDDLKNLGLFRGIKENPMRLAICSRSGDVIEPLMLPQWYVKCKQMGSEAADAVRNGEIAVVPEMHKSTWYNWLDNVHDWCISRQLWWGHRIPAWLVSVDGKHADATDPNSWIVAESEELAREKAIALFGPNIKLDQDPDVLDTWFSSGLFPFSVFGWPNNTADLQKYYPTTMIETGSDILFFWIARMVMMGKFLTGQWPFRTVLLHSMVRDAHGRKMSKSLGNVIDPIDVIEGITLEQLHDTLRGGNLDPREVEKAINGQKADFPAGISECGTDALRFSLCAYTSQGRDINLDINRVVGYRHFCNKIWNATKLTLSLVGEQYKPPASSLDSPTEPINQWIISRLNQAITESNEGFEQYDLSKSTNAIYNFWLYEFCDVYLEAIKPVFWDRTAAELESPVAQETRHALYTCVEEALRLIHPYMPFISEELWQRMPRRDSQVALPPSICLAQYPQANPKRQFGEIESQFTAVSTIVHAVRALRMEYGVVKKVKPVLVLNSHGTDNHAVHKKWASAIATLTNCAEAQITIDSTTAPAGAALTIPDPTCEAYIVLKGLVNVEQETTKLQAKLKNTKGFLESLNKKMSTPEYKTKVPHNVQEEDGKKATAYQTEISNIEKAIQNFQAFAT